MKLQESAQVPAVAIVADAVRINRVLLIVLMVGILLLQFVSRPVGFVPPTSLFGQPVPLILACLCLPSFAVLARDLRPWDRITGGLVVVLAQFCLSPMLDLTVILNHHTFDAAAVRLDGTWGWELRVGVASLLHQVPVLWHICLWVYFLLGAILAASAGSEFLGPTSGAPREGRFLVGFLLIGGIGYCLYLLMPIVGPAFYAGKSWAVVPPTLNAVAEPVARNCMPSLHLAWILLAVLSTRGRAWPLRLFFASMMLFTVLATLGFGLHYICDLSASVPLVLFVRTVCARFAQRRERIGGAILSIALLTAWVIIVRHGGGIGGLDAGWLVGSAALCLTWEHRMTHRRPIVPPFRHA